MIGLIEKLVKWSIFAFVLGVLIGLGRQLVLIYLLR